MAIGFLIAAAVMSLGGVAELVFGVRAEGQELEDLATPLTAQEGNGPGDGDGERGGAGTGERA